MFVVERMKHGDATWTWQYECEDYQQAMSIKEYLIYKIEFSGFEYEFRIKEQNEVGEKV